jgi:ribonuclease HII
MLRKNQQADFGEYHYIAGVDEAGRGPLAGPVVVAAVILDSTANLPGLNDSKKLSAKKREELFQLIIQQAVAYKIIEVSPEKIDQINILQATLWGMEEAVLNLELAPQICLIDGNRMPARISDISRTIIKGDSKYASIAAASILAKVQRDRIMLDFDAKYPQYNFAANKGYPTREHLAAIRAHGITPIHRRSYKPVQQYCFDF